MTSIPLSTPLITGDWPSGNYCRLITQSGTPHINKLQLSEEPEIAFHTFSEHAKVIWNNNELDIWVTLRTLPKLSVQTFGYDNNDVKVQRSMFLVSFMYNRFIS